MKEYYNFNSSDKEQTKIHGVKWTPDKEPVAVIQLVHGMIEYIERYDEFIDKKVTQDEFRGLGIMRKIHPLEYAYIVKADEILEKYRKK